MKVWGLLILCGALVLGALMGQTKNLLDIDKQRTKIELEAERQESARLVIAHMDSKVVDFLVMENRRTPDEFRARVGQSSEYIEEYFVSVGDAQVPILKTTALDEQTGKKLDQRADDAWINLSKLKQEQPQLKRNAIYQSLTNSLDTAQRAKEASRAIADAAALAENTQRQRGESSTVIEVSPLVFQWKGESLQLVRSVNENGEKSLQGMTLKLESLTESLLSIATPVIGGAILEPTEFADSKGAVGNSKAVRLAMTTMPFEFVLPPLDWSEMDTTSGVKNSLWISWVAILVAFTAVAFLVRGIIVLSERRASFVSAVTHELRTPLTTFRMYSEMLAEGMVADEKKRHKYLWTMKSEADRLAHLVENVLSFSRIERGSARSMREVITSEVLLDKVTQSIEPRLSTAEVQIEVHNKAQGEELDLDVSAVEQIVFNLVDNACKYGMPEEGEHEIELMLEVKQSSGVRSLILAVKDRGRGIADSDKKKIFQPFNKSAQDAANDQPGVGLGLALCRRMARQMKGELRVEDREGGGVVFTFELILDL